MMQKNRHWADRPHAPIRLIEEQENKESTNSTGGVPTKNLPKVKSVMKAFPIAQ